MPKLATVTIDVKGKPLNINEADFDPKKHKLFGEKKAAPKSEPSKAKSKGTDGQPSKADDKGSPDDQ